MASNGRVRQIRPPKSCIATELFRTASSAEGAARGETRLGAVGGRRSKRRRSRTVVDNDDLASSNCRKWRPLPLSETGFVISLLPRRQTAYSDVGESVAYGYGWSGAAVPNDEPSVPSSPLISITPTTCNCTCLAKYRPAGADDNLWTTDTDVEAVWLQCLHDSTKYDTSDNSDFDLDSDGELTDEYWTTANGSLLRTKKKWRVEKARRQLKTRHCQTVKNCVHGVSLYVSHRVIKRMTMTVQPTSHRPCCVTLRRIDKEKALLATQITKHQTAGRLPTHRINFTSAMHLALLDDDISLFSDSESHSLSTLLFAADTCNVDRTLSSDVTSLLVALQHRDLSPNDYELLLRLDDRIQPRTVSELQLSSLPVNELSATDIDQHSTITCAVCLESFIAGQRCKLLPCGHSFHDVCIDAWLRQSSTKCPLDGLELYS